MLSYMLAIQFGNSSTRRIRRREYIPFLWFRSDALYWPGELAAIREWDRLEKGIRREVLGIFGGSYWGFWISYKVERIKWFIRPLFLFMIWPELPSSSSIRRGRSTSPTWSDKRIYPALGIPKGIGKYFKAVCGFRPASLIFPWVHVYRRRRIRCMFGRLRGMCMLYRWKWVNEDGRNDDIVNEDDRSMFVFLMLGRDRSRLIQGEV